MSAGANSCIPTPLKIRLNVGMDSVLVSDPPITRKGSDYFGSGYEPDLEDEGHLGRPGEKKVLRKKVHVPFQETPLRSILKKSEETILHDVKHPSMRGEAAYEKRVPLKQVPGDEDEVFKKDYVPGISSSASNRIEQHGCKPSARGPVGVEKALRTTRRPSRAGCEMTLNKVIFYIGSSCSSDGYESMKEGKDSAFHFRERRRKREEIGKSLMNQPASKRRSSLEVDPSQPSGPGLGAMVKRISEPRSGNQDKAVYQRWQQIHGRLTNGSPDTQENGQHKTFSKVVYKPRPPPKKSSCRCF